MRAARRDAARTHARTQPPPMQPAAAAARRAQRTHPPGPGETATRTPCSGLRATWTPRSWPPLMPWHQTVTQPLGEPVPPDSSQRFRSRANAAGWWWEPKRRENWSLQPKDQEA